VPPVNERLWVRLRDGGSEAFITGEGGTFIDRFAIWVVDDADSRLCSQYELAQVSVEAALWLSGFLFGRIPHPPADDELMTEWREKRDVFLRSGAWPGRDDYVDYVYGHTLKVGAEVRVESADGDPDLAEADGRLGVILDILQPEFVGQSPEYFVMLDASGDGESDGWAIEERHLATTGEHRRDYDAGPFFPCPCCEFLTLPEEQRGSYEICPVCFWEDDAVQLAEPELAGGANKVSLNQARENFKRHGVSELRFSEHVRRPSAWEYPSPEVVPAPARPSGPG
jgi:hypothetical protein